MWTARLLPLMGMAWAVVWILRSGRSLTVDDILNYTPAEPLRAMLFLWLAFALKSLSMVFPVLLLFAVSGQLFPLPVALAVNTVGIAITLTIPYLLGRASELSFTDRLVRKYPKLLELRRVRETSAFFLSFIARAIGVLDRGGAGLHAGSDLRHDPRPADRRHPQRRLLDHAGREHPRLRRLVFLLPLVQAQKGHRINPS